MDGTSMATPHIAGLAALLYEAKKGATADQIENAIFESCKLLPRMTQDRAGRGGPNGPLALSILTGGQLRAETTSPLRVKEKKPARSERRATKRKRKSK